MKTYFNLIFFSIFFFISFEMSAQKTIQIFQTTESIKIDGIINETIWKQHLQVGNFVQTRPETDKPSKRITEIAILYDENYMYILGVLHVSTSEEISHPLTGRDDVGNADVFGIQIDPFGEAREGYDFSVTASGVQADEKISASQSYSNYNVVWESDVKIYEDKWIVEIKIPFNSFRFPKTNMSHFKINFQRISNVLNEESFWNPIKPNVDGFLNQFGTLEGLKTINPPLNLSLYPFVSVVNEKSPTGENKLTINGGLDLKYVHKNAYTLDISLIPDFSQAPSDNQVFNLSPFEVKYNENRQFFVEATEIFDKGGYLYTRRIGGNPIHRNSISVSENEGIVTNPVGSNILNLIKVTGKSSNGLSIGILNGVTAKSEVEIENITSGTIRHETTNPLTNYNAIAVDKALKNNSSLTFINNSVLRNGSDYDANLTALLYRWYPKKRDYTLYFKKAVSQHYVSNKKNTFGHDYFVYAGKVSGKWTAGISTKLVDDKFTNNDFGFLSRNNQLRFRSDLYYSNNNPKNTFSNYQFFADLSKRYYYSLKAHEQTYFKFGGNGTFKKNNHTFFADFTYFLEGQNFYEPRVKDRFVTTPAQTQTFFEYQTNRNKNISLSGYVVFVNYLNSKIYTNAFVSGYGLRARIGRHLYTYLSQSLDSTPNTVGYLTMQDDAILFGERSVKELNSELTLEYTMNSSLNLSANLRHYWIQVDYDKQYTLQDDGALLANTYAINLNDYDANYNVFSIDFLAKWQFAPASEISLAYKLGANHNNSNVNSSYFNNLKGILKEKSSNTISIKMVYFFDFNRLKTKRNNKSI